MNKKIVCAILAVLLILPLCACGKKPLKVMFIAFDYSNHEYTQVSDGLKAAIGDGNVDLTVELIQPPVDPTEEELLAGWKECVERHKDEKFDVIVSPSIPSWYEAGGDPEIPVVLFSNSASVEEAKEFIAEKNDAKYLLNVFQEYNAPTIIDRTLGEYLGATCTKDDNIGIIPIFMESFDKTALEQGKPGIEPAKYFSWDSGDVGESLKDFFSKNEINILCTDEPVALFAQMYKNEYGAEKVIYFGAYGDAETNGLMNGTYDAIVGNSYYDTGYALGRELVSIASGKAPKDVYVLPTVLTRDLLLK